MTLQRFQDKAGSEKRRLAALVNMDENEKGSP